MFDSSVAENTKLRHLWQDFILLADSDGCIDKPEFKIADILRVPLEDVIWAIEELSKPDPRSRSKEEEGRRIVPLDSNRDWGWRLVNYLHYRNIGREQMRREYHRDKMAKYRSAKGKGRDLNTPPPPPAKPGANTQGTYTEPEEPPLRAEAQAVWDILVAIKQFNLQPNDRLSQSGEVQHLIGTVHATEEQLRALFKFYALPPDSRHPEARTRKFTPRGLLTNWGEQIAMAMKVCAPKKAPPPPAQGKNGTPDLSEPPPSEEQKAAVRKSLEELRLRMKGGGGSTEPAPAPPQMGRHARRKKQQQKQPPRDDGGGVDPAS